jgi:O-antigen/teichoic acid export membrane protein
MVDSRTKASAFVNKLLVLQGSLALGMSLVIVVFAPQIVALVMGDRFQDAVPVLRTLGLLPFVVGLSNVLGIQLMLPFGLKREFSKIVSASAVLNILLIALLARLSEARGAAVGVLVTELFVTVSMFAVLKHKKIF